MKLLNNDSTYKLNLDLDMIRSFEWGKIGIKMRKKNRMWLPYDS